MKTVNKSVVWSDRAVVEGVPVAADELVAVVEATTGTTQIENMPAQSAEEVSLSLPRMTRTPTTKTTERKESQYCKKVNIDTYSYE